MSVPLYALKVWREGGREGRGGGREGGKEGREGGREGREGGREQCYFGLNVWIILSFSVISVLFL